QRNMLATGEPVELARRFCIANRFYGSRVLLGPRTFELASKILVARPIDFLSGVDVRERHEIYEPVVLALEASRDQITRRDALWIVQARGDQPANIARAIAATRESVRPCPRCGFFTMEEICGICSDTTRAADLLCVVEQATDILPLEKTSAFRGRYHSLGGRISPLDHVGPDDLRIKELVARVEQEKFSEVILALAADVEGEATT